MIKDIDKLLDEKDAEIERLREERDDALRLHADRAERMTGLSERMYAKGYADALEEAAQIVVDCFAPSQGENMHPDAVEALKQINALRGIHD